MKIRKFDGNSLDEVMMKVRKELGGDAVILETRTIPGGRIEVSASVEEGYSPKNKFLRTSENRSFRPRPEAGRASFVNESGTERVKKVRRAVFPRMERTETGFRKIERIRREPVVSPSPTTISGDNTRRNDKFELGVRLDKIEKLLESIITKTPRGTINNMSPEINQKHSGIGEDFAEWLNNRGIEPSLWNDFGTENGFGSTLESKTTGFRKSVTSRLRTATPLDSIQGSGPRKIALVGPTGSGKTTTIAKLAGWLTIKKKKKVALLSLDTFRVGAARQLETYAEILQIPFSVVRDAESIKFALGSFGARDVVLIDTTGRNPYGDQDMDKLENMLRVAGADEIHITLPATHTGRYLHDAWIAFNRTGGDRLILTKLDEAPRCGHVLSLVADFSPSFSFLTFGQIVPDDFCVAEPSRITDMIFGAGRYAGSGRKTASTG